jgi:hypothetical protein
MGPLGEKRGDDPKDGLDQTYEPDGEQTLNTKIAHAMKAQGGIAARLAPDEVRADLATPIFDAKLKALLELKKTQKDEALRKVSQAEIADLMKDALLEVKDTEVDDEVLARTDAAGETRRLLAERDQLEVERVAGLEKQIAAFEKTHAKLLARLKADEVLADLKAAADEAEKDRIPRSAVDKEIARRQGLVRQLARLRDLLAHAPKRYEASEWREDGGMKTQKGA